MPVVSSRLPSVVSVGKIHFFLGHLSLIFATLCFMNFVVLLKLKSVGIFIVNRPEVDNELCIVWPSLSKAPQRAGSGDRPRREPQPDWIPVCAGGPVRVVRVYLLPARPPVQVHGRSGAGLLQDTVSLCAWLACWGCGDFPAGVS